MPQIALIHNDGSNMVADIRPLPAPPETLPETVDGDILATATEFNGYRMPIPGYFVAMIPDGAACEVRWTYNPADGTFTASPALIAAQQKASVMAQITGLEGSVTPRMMQEAATDSDDIFPENTAFEGLTAKQAIASIRAKIKALQKSLET